MAQQIGNMMDDQGIFEIPQQQVMDVGSEPGSFALFDVEYPNVLRAPSLVHSIAIGFYNQLPPTKGWMVNNPVIQESELENLENALGYVRRVNGDIREMKIFATGNSLLPKEDDELERLSRDYQTRYCQQVEQLLQSYFPNAQKRVKWLDDWRDGEFRLDTLDGKFELEVYDLKAGYNTGTEEYTSF